MKSIIYHNYLIMYCDEADKRNKINKINNGDRNGFIYVHEAIQKHYEHQTEKSDHLKFAIGDKVEVISDGKQYTITHYTGLPYHWYGTACGISLAERHLKKV